MNFNYTDSLSNNEQPDADDLIIALFDREDRVLGSNDPCARLAEASAEKSQFAFSLQTMPQSIAKGIKEDVDAGKITAAYHQGTYNGSLTWYFNIYVPVEDGYLAIGLKPKASTFQNYISLYEQLHLIEKNYENQSKKGLEESSTHLKTAMEGLGFNSRDLLVFELIRDEIEFKKTMSKEGDVGKLNGKEIPIVFEKIMELVNRRNVLLDKARKLSIFAKELELVAINSTVRASFLGRTGAPLSIIGKEISLMSQLIGKEVNQFSNTSVDLVRDLNKSYLMFAVSELQEEFKESVCENEANNSKNLGTEKLLNAVTKSNIENSRSSINHLRSVLESMARFESTIESLNKVFQVLQFSYVAGCAEMARISEEEDFKPLFDNLKSISDEGKSELTEIDNALSSIRGLVNNSLKNESIFVN